VTRDAISNEPKPTCASCGVPWADHMGIMGVCLWNRALKEDLKDLREELVQHKMWLTAADINWQTIRTERDKLREERDEARREVCNLSAIYSTYYHVDDQAECAEDRGWDCYKETP
jgi:hypothetical protein